MNEMALKSTIQQFIPILEINRDRPTLVKQNNKILLTYLVMKNEKFTPELFITVKDLHLQVLTTENFMNVKIVVNTTCVGMKFTIIH